ncbi:predicted protein [Verticillium alfalfae VaMs.102]|uniref:Predicted protein n=1 Tax=Verticillium alfalfae (strain VaMs.102 / ATCC MYA-4576 / FGSC 10136) TaxID=526221 RepID=C9SA52_VERA1|nr:predicted protein [Verticillium alfalfae VaMs.102]EEY16265.1 predicted protein [Verticillium alfalfae VaMs.102]
MALACRRKKNETSGFRGRRRVIGINGRDDKRDGAWTGQDRTGQVVAAEKEKRDAWLPAEPQEKNSGMALNGIASHGKGLSWSESARSTAWQLPFGQIVMLLTDMIDRRFLAAGSQHSARGKGQRTEGRGLGRPRGKSAPWGCSIACSWVTAFNIGRS